MPKIEALHHNTRDQGEAVPTALLAELMCQNLQAVQELLEASLQVESLLRQMLHKMDQALEKTDAGIEASRQVVAAIKEAH